MSQTVMGLKLKEALQKSPEGVFLYKPLMERVWLYVKDHPGVLTSHLSGILKEDSGSISSIVSQMANREMLLREKQAKPYKGVPSYYLRVNPKMRGEYELLPLPNKPNAQINVSVEKLQPVQPENKVVEEKQSISVETFDLESLTIREARQLQARLNQLFGGK